MDTEKKSTTTSTSTTYFLHNSSTKDLRRGDSGGDQTLQGGGAGHMKYCPEAVHGHLGDGGALEKLKLD
ncbi:hypothetical protein E2C01_029472 [Portunus trituberculatus]|uniref:Uncharacterized protein n=1 Tax=Portunus trituberculatus TaxID=210409 RepID=A0A5B7ERX7_PORTR|nr:hypothetical protein [Portunus trituberculatus]